MKDQHTIALVLRTQPYSETSQLLRVLGPEGIVNMLARGITRKTNRFGGPFDVLEIGEFTYRVKRTKELNPLREMIAASHREWFPGLRDSLQSYCGAELIREILLSAPLPDAEATETLHLALLALRALEEGKSPLAVGARFISTLLTNWGLPPELYHCMATGREASGKASVEFSLREQGLLSPPAVKRALEEGHPESDLIRLTPSLLALLRGLFTSGAKLGASQRSTWNEAFLFCEVQLQMALGRTLQSTPLLLAECKVSPGSYRALMAA